jgi:hypothetical protein
MKSDAKLWKIILAGLLFSPVCPAATLDIQKDFTPSGWMGDGEYGTKYVVLNAACTDNPSSAPMCIEVTYRFGPKGSAGIYWQNIPGNWGNLPGENLKEKGFAKLTFQVRGKKGGECVEFKSGGIVDANLPCRDSYRARTGKITLGKEWQTVTIDLAGKDLSSVIGAFCWVAARADNGGDSITFYLDDIRFE